MQIIISNELTQVLAFRHAICILINCKEKIVESEFYNVAINKKKTITFLAAIALGGVAMMLCSAQAVGNEPAKTILDSSGPPLAPDPITPMGSGGSTNTQELFFRMMLMVALVIVLGAAVFYISKKFLPKLSNLPGKKIRIIETVHLGPRKTVHLLKIGNQHILVGSTNENIATLADLTGLLDEMPITQVDNN